MRPKSVVCSLSLLKMQILQLGVLELLLGASELFPAILKLLPVDASQVWQSYVLLIKGLQIPNPAVYPHFSLFDYPFKCFPSFTPLSYRYRGTSHFFCNVLVLATKGTLVNHIHPFLEMGQYFVY